MKTSPYKKLTLVENDPWLAPAEHALHERIERFHRTICEIEDIWGSLLQFADGYKYFGFHYDRLRKGWIYREWAPKAHALYLVGDFNDWQSDSHRMDRDEYGIWKIFLPDDQYRYRFTHQSKVKVRVHSDIGCHDRIPAYIQRVVQDPNSLDFSGQIWNPPHPFDWTGDRSKWGQVDELLIYECHVGMAQEKEGIGTFLEFTDHILPYIKNAGYNAIQLMAIAEHPYYASFGYQVASFFAVSSRFGSPEDLKYLIKKAHGQGMAVIMDLVHSHTVKNIIEGLNLFDGSENQYFHAGERGNHPHWNSKCFDYGKREVLQFLLSNIKFWMKEFHFDGFRFDGVNSMMYFDHGFRDVWDFDGYFKSGVDLDALVYLQLANALVHRIKPGAVTIAEDVSGMPGLCRPIKDGGIGFDYRMGMAIPDYWIKILKEKKDEQWDIHEIWQIMNNRLPDVKTVSYCESHDQALVGDQTLAFRLMQTDIYYKMSKKDESPIIDRGMALHKMIRLFTLASGGQAYLNFMGNEFGHPDWIDFPREGNNWNFQYARRQWSLLANRDLRFHFLAAFDRHMMKLVKDHKLFQAPYGNRLNMDEKNKTIIFERNKLIFIFNFHASNSIYNYEFMVADPGDYRIVLNSDNPAFGGHGRIDEKIIHTTLYNKDEQTHSLMIYNTNRTAIVFKRESQ